MRGDIRALTQRLERHEIAVLRAEAMYNQTRDMVIAIHRNQEALRLLVQERFGQLQETIRASRPLGLSRRLRRIELLLTNSDFKSALERVDREIQALVQSITPEEKVAMSPDEEAKIRALAEKRWRQQAQPKRAG